MPVPANRPTAPAGSYSYAPYWLVNIPALNGVDQLRFELVVDPSIRQPRCIVYSFAIGSGWGRETGAIALRHNCVTLIGNDHVNNNEFRPGFRAGAAALEALARFEPMLGMSLRDLPWWTIAHSGNNGPATAVVRAMPERAIAMLVLDGGATTHASADRASVVQRGTKLCSPVPATPTANFNPLRLQVPHLHVMGEHDPYWDDPFDNQALDSSPRKSPAHLFQWMSIGQIAAGIPTTLNVTHREGHRAGAPWNDGASRGLFDVWVDGIMALRMPATPGQPLRAIDPNVQGWRGYYRHPYDIAPAAQVPAVSGDRECWLDHANWFPNEETARLWQAHARSVPWDGYLARMFGQP